MKHEKLEDKFEIIINDQIENLPIRPPQIIQYTIRSAYVWQRGTKSVAIPATVRPILLTRRGDI